MQMNITWLFRIALLWIVAAWAVAAGSGRAFGQDDESAQENRGGSSNTAAGPGGEFARTVGRIERRGARSRMGDSMVGLLQPLASPYADSVVCVLSGQDQLALGTIVDSDGSVLTCASVLKDPVEIQLNDGRKLPAKLVGLDESTDLALLKVDLQGLPAVTFANRDLPAIGAWMLSVAPNEQPASIGVVSVAARRIPNSRSFIGIQMDDADQGGVRITQVVADSPADLANLRVNDVIKSINGRAVADMAGLRAALGEYEPGDRVELAVARGEEQLAVPLELANADQFNRESIRTNQQERMGSRLSDRRSNFPLAFQHDSYLQAGQMGGILVDIDGQIAGINISRAGRVATLALPVSVVIPSLEKLRSGSLAPALVYRNRIEAISAKLESVGAELAPLADQIRAAEEELVADRARREELERMRGELDARIAEIEARSGSLRGSVEELTARSELLKAQQERLQRERQQLERGIKN